MTPPVEHLPREELIKQLSEPLGSEKAEEVVQRAAAAAGFGDLTEFDREQTLAILERLAVSPGLVGVVARFAKVRLILRFK